MTTGPSDTPLAKKLNLRDDQHVWFEDMPASIQDEIDEYALELIFVGNPDEGFDAGHIFVTNAVALTSKLNDLRNSVTADGHIWVSWPQKESGQKAELDQAQVQQIGRKAGFIDTKEFAVDDAWSAVKFVIPKADR